MPSPIPDLSHKSPAGRTLGSGDAINLWEVSELVEASYPGMPRPAEDRVQYNFRNGFTDVGDLPCREAFLTEMRGRPIAPKPDFRTAAIYAPRNNRRVEFSGFRYTPTHVRFWARTVLYAKSTGTFTFRLETCGGVRLWVNGAPVASFEPFERNGTHATEISIDLKAGTNEVLLHMEDLFERDTDFFYELTYLGDAELAIALTPPGDAAAFARLEQMAFSIRPDADVFVNQPLVMRFDDPVEIAADVAVMVISHGHDRSVLFENSVTLKQGQNSVELAPAGAIVDGYHAVRLRFAFEGATLDAHLDAGFMQSLEMFPAADTEAERKQRALRHVAQFGAPRIGRVLAMYATDLVHEVEAYAIITETLRDIEERRDCSDFSMVPLLSLWALYQDKLPESLRPRVKNAILEWRYWVDEPGNDVMWFWSENHTLCFHASQLMAGMLFPNEVFACSRRKGAEQVALAEERLDKWFNAIEAHGLVEWNSAAYYPIDFIGLFGVYHLAKGSIKDRAKSLLDKLFVMIGLHTLEGVPAGTMGRAYDKELRAGPLTELAPIAQVAFGPGWQNIAASGLPQYLVSDYEAPEIAKKAALYDGPGLFAQYVQGADPSGWLSLYKNGAAMLSSVADHAYGQPGHQQHVVDVRLAGHPMARLWVNHPGEDDPWGSHRPSYWAGNGVMPRVRQFGATALMLYDLGAKARIPWTHAFAACDGLDALEVDGQFIFARSGDGYAALWACSPIEAITAGPTSNREFRAAGSRSAWILHVGQGQGATDFDGFKSKMHAADCVFDPEKLNVSCAIPNAPRLSLSWENGFVADGAPFPFTDLSTEPHIDWASDVLSH